jgi:mannose-1-phosphate guanylyltransferase
MLHVVIMAGGSGTRFWPVSRQLRPKQLVALAADQPILRLTFERVAPLVPAERTWVVTTKDTAGATRDLLPELPHGNVLAEPEGRDTAACAGFAARVVLHHDPEAVCAMLPSDHIIGEPDRFRAALLAAAEMVSAEGGLLTFGVEPTRAETGYGYLKLGDRHRVIDGWPVHGLARFVEKPDTETAHGYISDGSYLWNSGMFVWRAEEFLDEVRRQLPKLADGLDRVAGALQQADFEAAIEEIYPGLTRTSVDYGVMEGARRCWTMPVDFPWSDVGAWPALAELLPPDPDGNATRGRILTLGADRNLVISDGPVVALAGVQDLVVVATGDAVLVVPADEAQRVKEIVAELEQRGWHDVL